MKPYEPAKTEQVFKFSIQDLQILENLKFVILPSAEIPYMFSSTNGSEYALYQVSQNIWKHSAAVTNFLLLQAVDAINNVVLLNSSNKETEPVKEESSGFACDYYRVGITHPMTKEQVPYIAECGDIMESLNMTYAEANAFKAIWRTAAARTLGLEKSGNTSLRDAEKIKFFAERHYLRESVNANNGNDRIVRKHK